MGRIGVCSWSLRPEGPVDLLAKVRACGLDAVQLALDPLRTGRWGEGATAAELREGGIAVLSGMMSMEGEDYSTLESIRRTGGVRADVHWDANLRAARENAALARRLRVQLVTFHAGFLPHDRGDPLRATMIGRVGAIAEAFADAGIVTALETGQESAETLVGVLEELGRDTVGVNFDPANMVLYGMGDPVEALRRLAPWVRQVHIKDAVPAGAPGVWGEERPVGTGGVDWPKFLGVLVQECPSIDLVIEREGGDTRVEDVRSAKALVQRLGAGRIEC